MNEETTSSVDEETTSSVDEEMSGSSSSSDYEDAESEIEVDESYLEHMQKDDSNSEKVNEEVPKMKKQVYLPGKPLEDGEQLIYDPEAYKFFHSMQTFAPCLSFDIVPDNLGNNREEYPLTTYLVAGTQAERANANNIILMKISNIHPEMNDNESSEESVDDDNDNEKNFRIPQLDTISIKHHGSVNRIKCTNIGDKMLTAVWSEKGKVSLFNLQSHIIDLDTGVKAKHRHPKPIEILPNFVFHGHQTEGFALDWCQPEPGVLASGDCKKFIHIWRPSESTWIVDQKPLIGHKSSVEDLQWSPKEKYVLASCSSDKSIRIWDTRESGNKACKLTLENAHKKDVNVISWNKFDPLIVSGGDDGYIYIWDLRLFKNDEAVAEFKHHKDVITSVEWCPYDSSVMASAGEDNQIAIWDLGVENDFQEDNNDENDEQLQDIPEQLLFIHQGQKEIREIHWHPQITGMVISTASNGFNFFRPISV